MGCAGAAVKRNRASSVRRQTDAFLLRHVDRWDVEVAVLDQWERVDRAGQLRVARGGGDDRLRLHLPEQAEDPLVLFRL